MKFLFVAGYNLVVDLARRLVETGSAKIRPTRMRSSDTTPKRPARGSRWRLRNSVITLSGCYEDLIGRILDIAIDRHGLSLSGG